MPATGSTGGIHLLTIPETAAALRQHRATIYRKVQAGELPAIRLGEQPGRPIRVPADELRRYLERHTVAVDTADT